MDEVRSEVTSDSEQMLRTCSLPDPSKICSGSTEPDVASPHNNNLEIEDLEDKDDEQSYTDAYEDGDLQEVRDSMERLLQRDDDDDEEDGVSDSSPPDEDEHAGVNCQSKSSPVEGTSKSAATMEEDDDNLNHSPEEEASNGHDAEEDEEQNSERKLNEEWQSDDSEEDGMSDSEQQDSRLSRLKEQRFHLEQAMGFENFIQVYNILGPEHQHLYPKLLHLVKADRLPVKKPMPPVPQETMKTEPDNKAKVKEFCKVLFPYDAQNEDELSVKKGAIVSKRPKKPPPPAASTNKHITDKKPEVKKVPPEWPKSLPQRAKEKGDEIKLVEVQKPVLPVFLPKKLPLPPKSNNSLNQPSSLPLKRPERPAAPSVQCDGSGVASDRTSSDKSAEIDVDDFVSIVFSTEKLSHPTASRLALGRTMVLRRNPSSPSTTFHRATRFFNRLFKRHEGEPAFMMDKQREKEQGKDELDSFPPRSLENTRTMPKALPVITAPEKSSKPSGLTTTPGTAALRPHSPSMEAKVKGEQGSTMLDELRELRTTVELMKCDGSGVASDRTSSDKSAEIDVDDFDSIVFSTEKLSHPTASRLALGRTMVLRRNPSSPSTTFHRATRFFNRLFKRHEGEPAFMMDKQREKEQGKDELDSFPPRSLENTRTMPKALPVITAPEKSSKPLGLTTTPGTAALRPHSPSMEAKVKGEQGSTMLDELRELRATVELMKQEMKQLVSELDNEKRIRLSLQRDVENIKKVLSK